MLIQLYGVFLNCQTDNTILKYKILVGILSGLYQIL